MSRNGEKFSVIFPARLRMKVSLLIFFLFVAGFCSAQVPSSFGIGGLFEISLTDEDGDKYNAPDDILAIFTGFRLAIQDINSDETLLPNTKLNAVIFDTSGTVAGALEGLVEADARGLSVVIGPSYSEQSLISAVASGVYDILLASHSSSSSSLSASSLYPLFVRAVAADTFQARIFIDLIEYYYERTGEENWREIGIICTADDYGVGGARDIISRGEERGIETVAFQQFLVGAEDVSVEVRELENSGSRVFISYMLNTDYQTMIREADDRGIIGDYYVWMCSDGCATEEAFEDSRTGEIDPRFRELSLGYIGVLPQGGTGVLYDDYLQRWNELDPNDYFGAGPGTTPPIFSLLSYEMTLAAAYAINDQFSRGNFNPNGTSLYDSIRGIQFTSLTGRFELETNGDRRSDFQVVNLYPDRKFHQIFTWLQPLTRDEEEKLASDNYLREVSPTFWHDGTTNIPDLDVREEFDYWSCHDKESGTDVTGKLINLETPDGSDINFIKGSYECDQFIDCLNMSDEAYQCTPSYTIAFIIIGILTGLFILAMCLCIPIVVIFGCCVPRHRFRLSGVLFLFILSVACVVGFFSTYAWYGKPHPVACNFQLWLLGLPISAVIVALLAKQIRFWRSTAGTMCFRRITKSDKKGSSSPLHPELEFLIYFLGFMLIPLLLLLLWASFATPTADIIDIDDEDHYLCTSGGLAGEPAGLVFFFLLVAYLAVLLISAMIFSFFARHVPRPFLDKQSTFISLFNLSFLCAVVIPVFFVLRYISPFAAWIVRTFAILYGFGSTLLLHMIPKVIGLCLDKCQDNQGDGAGPSKPTSKPDYDMGSMTQSQSLN